MDALREEATKTTKDLVDRDYGYGAGKGVDDEKMKRDAKEAAKTANAQAKEARRQSTKRRCPLPGCGGTDHWGSKTKSPRCLWHELAKRKLQKPKKLSARPPRLPPSRTKWS